MSSPHHYPREGAWKELREWFLRPPGRWLLESECERITQVLPNLFGYYLLQIGWTGDAEPLNCSRVGNRIIMLNGDIGAGVPFSGIRGCACALPVATDCIDVVLLPHVLEFEEDPHACLREVERVLIPEGHVVVTGFNPWSLFGVWRLTSGKKRRVPWSGQFMSLTRLKDWLALLGFDVVSSGFFFFRPPIGNGGIMDRLRPLDAIGKKFWPYFGGAYFVVAKKRVITLTPIKTKWRPQPSLVTAGAVGPTTRSKN
ncbi:MAG: class I SAM-dependent methyltransferase [Gammaproteobacteria bacterium]|nr:class I SAM-dependent methyltransferase [Gammaproteobacteria bacterium]